MSIRDPDIKTALSILETEFEHLEESLKERDQDLREALALSDSLREDIFSLDKRIIELEEALAEAYLTSNSSNGFER